jgi:hypothetical protein
MTRHALSSLVDRASPSETKPLSLPLKSRSRLTGAGQRDNATTKKKQQFNQTTEKINYKSLTAVGDLVFRINLSEEMYAIDYAGTPVSTPLQTAED